MLKSSRLHDKVIILYKFADNEVNVHDYRSEVVKFRSKYSEDSLSFLESDKLNTIEAYFSSLVSYYDPYTYNDEFIDELIISGSGDNLLMAIEIAKFKYGKVTEAI